MALGALEVPAVAGHLQEGGDPHAADQLGVDHVVGVVAEQARAVGADQEVGVAPLAVVQEGGLVDDLGPVTERLVRQSHARGGVDVVGDLDDGATGIVELLQVGLLVLEPEPEDQFEGLVVLLGRVDDALQGEQIEVGEVGARQVLGEVGRAEHQALVDQLGGLDPKLRELLRLDVPSIVAKLDVDDRYEKGLALEAFGFKLMRTAGLSYVSTRFRPTSGGRFEVDLLFDTQRLSYSRWQVQCKNTDRVSLDDVAKEVGLTYYLLSNVIVLVTRGEVGADARRYANDVMKKTNLAIILIDRADIDEILRLPLAIFDVLEREAEHALDLKPLASQTRTQPDPAASVVVP